MSKKFKSHASSARATSAFGGFGSFQTTSSPLSYITEFQDLSNISDASIVVSFKNLAKKDSTTKEKALEDLQNSLRGSSDPAILTAWSEIYPRTSIDNSRRVRIAAHTLQGALTVFANKKIAPYLGKVIGPWLAGKFDGDRNVGRAAQAALDAAFPTQEKQSALWTAYKESILDHVRDAVTIQTANTLSDERVTSPDDAEAKYVRVVGGAIYMFNQLAENGSHMPELLHEKTLWNFANHSDSYLRNAMYTLGVTALHRCPEDLDWQLLSTCFLYEGLRQDQTGSTRQFLETLLYMTRGRPTLWTTDYVARTPVLKRLIHFLKQGSQNGPEQVWTNLSRLLEVIPITILMSDPEDRYKIAEAIKVGVLKERVHVNAAWSAYIQAIIWMVGKIDDQSHKADFANVNLAPLLRQYILNESDPKWTVAGLSLAIIVALISGLLQHNLDTVVSSLWESLICDTIEKLKLSLPETSKGYRNSQDTVITQAQKIYSLQSKVLGNGNAYTEFRQTCQLCDKKLLTEAIEILISRNGKPYCAAGILYLLAQQGIDTNQVVNHFLEERLRTFLDSPSAEILTKTALKCNVPVVELLLAQSQSKNTDAALAVALRQGSENVLEDRKVRDLLSQRMFNSKDEPREEFLLSMLENSALQHSNLQSSVLNTLVKNLSKPHAQSSSLDLLQKIVGRRETLQSIQSEQLKTSLVSQLLAIEETGSLSAPRAAVLAMKLSSTATTSKAIIQQQLNGEGTPLSILTLVDLASGIASEEPLSSILPTSAQWTEALKPHLQSNLDSNLTVTNPLHGALWTCTEIQDHPVETIQRDSEDFSQIFRFTFYVTKIFHGREESSLEPHIVKELCDIFPIALQLVNEKLTLDNANEIWLSSTPEVEQEAAAVLSDGMIILRHLASTDEFQQRWLDKGHSTVAQNRMGYLLACSLTTILPYLLESRGASSLLQEYNLELTDIHNSEDVLRNAALLSAFGEIFMRSSNGKRICNELIADATENPTTVKPLILLNILLESSSEILSQIPQQRLIFLLKNLIRILQTKTGAFLVEAMILLAKISLFVHDIYGEHWEQIIQYLYQSWGAGINNIPVLHASLRLFASLKSLQAMDDSSEDLQEAWTDAKPDLDTGLLQCLYSFDTPVHGVDQPRKITAELLRRQLKQVHIEGEPEFINLLSSPEPSMQSATFELLHRFIPHRQEELSVELALEKKTAHLSDELMANLSDASDPRKYLLSWKLIFDHFTNASHVLRESYVSDIKKSNTIALLLDFLTSHFRIVDGRPVDASKYEIHDYYIDDTLSDDVDMRWLSIHLYFECLMNVPGLAKEWFLQQLNRVKLPLEKWTKQFISPLVIASSLDAVNVWAAMQSQDESDKPVKVKTSPRGSELVASIAVDPESPPISLVVTLPSSYPLEPPSVASRERVGVSEKNWNSWMRTFEIIIFTTGSIVEGLIAFRRNVQLALEGQSECAICYSIIGTDMKTPDKKCGTCKNTFHGICLYRWFKSSNSSSCPLCRNNFNYA